MQNHIYFRLYFSPSLCLLFTPFFFICVHHFRNSVSPPLSFHLLPHKNIYLKLILFHSFFFRFNFLFSVIFLSFSLFFKTFFYLLKHLLFKLSNFSHIFISSLWTKEQKKCYFYKCSSPSILFFYHFIPF